MGSLGCWAYLFLGLRLPGEAVGSRGLGCRGQHGSAPDGWESLAGFRIYGAAGVGLTFTSFGLQIHFGVIRLMDKILHYFKDPKLWELWYIPYYGSCRILSISRINPQPATQTLGYNPEPYKSLGLISPKPATRTLSRPINPKP